MPEADPIRHCALCGGRGHLSKDCPWRDSDDKAVVDLLTPQAQRFVRIERLLSRGRVVSFGTREFALGVSPATVKRDLQDMRGALGAPIEYGQGGYRFAADWPGVAAAINQQVSTA